MHDIHRHWRAAGKENSGNLILKYEGAQQPKGRHNPMTKDGWMNKLAYTHNGILFSNKNTDTCYKSLNLEDTMLSEISQIHCRIPLIRDTQNSQITETEVRKTVTRS